MNIQIFGTAKCFDTKKALRFFSDRKIKVQFIDIEQKPMSRGEFNSVKAALGGYEAMANPACKDKELLTLYSYLCKEQQADKLFDNQRLILTPVVRNGRLASVGYAPQIWKTWL